LWSIPPLKSNLQENAPCLLSPQFYRMERKFMDENVKLAKKWTAKALSDLLNADNNLRAESIPYDTVCFHCQQAAEKLLKAYLIAKGENYPLSHDLLLLLQCIEEFDRSAEHIRDWLIVLIPYAVEIRYPDECFVPSPEDAIEARQAAEQVKEFIFEVCPSIFD
jgi:HEPN domain-containing protein